MDANDFNNNDKDLNSNSNSNKDSITHKVGDSLERLGKKITDAGAPKIGKVIYNAGDKIEHMKDK